MANESPSAVDLLDDLDRRMQSVPEPVPEPEHVGPEKLIAINYQLGDGIVLQGDFVYRVPSVADRREIARYDAALRRGIPPELLSEDARLLVWAEAYLLVTIRRFPEWADKDGRLSFDALADPRPLRMLFEEAGEHERRFLGAGRDLRPSPKAS